MQLFMYGLVLYQHVCLWDTKSYCLVGKEDIVCYFLFLAGATNMNVRSQRYISWEA